MASGPPTTAPVSGFGFGAEVYSAVKPAEHGILAGWAATDGRDDPRWCTCCGYLAP